MLQKKKSALPHYNSFKLKPHTYPSITAYEIRYQLAGDESMDYQHSHLLMV